MTERQQERETIASERERTGLSTADMAAAAERREPAQTDAPARPQDDAVPIETRADVPAMDRPSAQADAQPTSLLPTEEARAFRSRWDSIQTGFVDEPRQSVEQADSLVAELMKHLAEIFADERDRLEHQWSRGDDVSTEDLRIALRRYRSFFDRLLSM